MEQAFHGKAGQFPPCQGRYLRLVYAEELSGLSLGQAALGNDIQDLAGKLCLCEAFFGIRQAKVGKYVAAAVINFGLFLRDSYLPIHSTGFNGLAGME